MKKAMKIFGRTMVVLATALIIVGVLESCWMWRVAYAYIEGGSIAADTTLNAPEISAKSTLRLEAFNEDGTITGIKNIVEYKGNTIFAVNIQKSYVNIIIGDKIFNLNKGSF